MVVRKYGIPDADMLQKSRTKQQHFINHKADFVAFDADFDDPFAADWLASIEDSEAVETAETRDDTSRQETADVNNVMGLAYQKHIEMKYFIEKALVVDGVPSQHHFRGIGFPDSQKFSFPQLNYFTAHGSSIIHHNDVRRGICLSH